MRAFPQKVILIAGGYDKHIPFTELASEVIEHVKLLILCGNTAEKIRSAVLECQGYAGAPEIILCDSIEDAVSTAAARAERGDVVTLSPACAAFDSFPNFMVRGETYKRLVNAL